jgi:uncharacterized membrane protein
VGRAAEQAVCMVCGRRLPVEAMQRGAAIRAPVAELMIADVPGWAPDGFVCREDLDRYRRIYVERMLEAERGELSRLDREVIDSLAGKETVSQLTERTYDERQSFGGRLADQVATFGGSWGFIVSFCLVLALWMAANATGLLGRFDPYPFILLNLVLSCIAALQAPVIMMSQRRQEAKDRLRAENDYKVNLKAELEIRHLHEKLDHQMAQQWERLTEIQRIQIEMLEEAARDRR